ncbi:hypothetical protein A2U01_0013200, partial [Trifolium medium]|nr:hypothetical protein [Trifolium medium]
MVLSLQASHE